VSVCVVVLSCFGSLFLLRVVVCVVVCVVVLTFFLSCVVLFCVVCYQHVGKEWRPSVQYRGTGGLVCTDKLRLLAVLRNLGMRLPELGVSPSPSPPPSPSSLLLPSHSLSHPHPHPHPRLHPRAGSWSARGDRNQGGPALHLAAHFFVGATFQG
jgi:hypothetical protein